MMLWFYWIYYWYL